MRQPRLFLACALTLGLASIDCSSNNPSLADGSQQDAGFHDSGASDSAAEDSSRLDASNDFDGSDASTRTLCTSALMDLGALSDNALNETSGLVSSRDGAYLFAHNDSGDSARFFALNAAGRVHAEYRLRTSSGPAAANIDYEDIARCEINGSSFLVLADVGDNAAREMGSSSGRSGVVLYWVAEPSVPSSPVNRAIEIDARAQRLTYPDGAHDVEAVACIGNSLFAFTKENSGPSRIYRIDSQDASSFVAAGTLGINVHPNLPGFMVTGVDYSSELKALAVRTYLSILVIPNAQWPNLDASTSDLFIDADHAITLALPTERQGEAIAFRKLSGTSTVELFSVAEGANAELHQVAVCSP